MTKSAKTPGPGVLGEIDLPEGQLLILDPGLARFWRHDAEAAGRAYDREFDPRFLFDRTDPRKAVEHFGQFAREKGFDAHAEVLGASDLGKGLFGWKDLLTLAVST